MKALFYKGEDIVLTFTSVTDMSGYTKVVKFFTFGSAVKTATVTAVDNYNFTAKLAKADTADLKTGRLNIVLEFTDGSTNKTISKTIDCKLADAYVDGDERYNTASDVDILFTTSANITVSFLSTVQVEQSLEEKVGFSNIKQTVGESETDLLSQAKTSLFFDRKVKDYDLNYNFKGFCIAAQSAPAAVANDVYYYTGTTSSVVFGVANVTKGSFLVYDGSSWKKYLFFPQYDPKFLYSDSDISVLPPLSILEFDIRPTANIEQSKEYYIAYLYNTPTPSFLIQIKDDSGNIVTQHYLASSNLTGKNKITLNNTSDGQPFADVYIDADRFPTVSADLGTKLHLKKNVLLTPVSFEKDLIPSQKMAEIISASGKVFRKEMDLTNTFPFWAIKDISVIKAPNDIDFSFYTSGILKDLYFVYIRKKGISANVNTIIQVGEKIGSSVGVNLNTWAAITLTSDITETIGTYTLIGNSVNAPGLELSITIDWTNITLGSYSLTTQAPLYVPRLLQQAKNIFDGQILSLKKGFWLNPKNTSFNYNAILSIEVLSGDTSIFYNNGVLRELYLTFIRLVGLKNNPATNIVQIAWKDGSSVGLNNKAFASSPADDTRNMSSKPIESFILEGATGYESVRIKCVINTALIPLDILENASLSDTLQLNTKVLIEQLASSTYNTALRSKKIVCFGDSVTEFGDYPKRIGKLTSSTTYNIGFGGCRLAERSDSSYYNELGMVKVAQSVASQNFTNLLAAVEYLKNNAADDNSANANRLVSIDFNTVDVVTIFYGTNDFSSGGLLGNTGSTDTFTITGAVNSIVNSLLTAYPHLRILFITPTHRFFNTSDDSDLVANSAGKYLIEYCDAIISEAHKNHIPALDMYREGGVNKYNHAYYFGADNVHPNTTGYAYLSEKISAKLIQLFKY